MRQHNYLEVNHKRLKVSNREKVFYPATGFTKAEHKTTVSVYSLRAKEHPTLSTPVSWKEIVDTAKKGDTDLLIFEAGEVLRRVKKKGDCLLQCLRLNRGCQTYQ